MSPPLVPQVSPDARKDHMKWLDRTTAWTVALSLGALTVAAPLAAQTQGNGYLFREPIASFNLRGGFAHAMAGSDIFSFSKEQFTLGSWDFSGPTAAADLGIAISDRLEIVGGVGYSGSQATTHYRGFVEDNEGEDEILQTHTFMRVPLTASLKAYLTSPGRAIGQFAWVPARYAPYVGAGAGGMWYRFEQEGDFINSETLVIRTDRLESAGWTQTAHAFTGVDFSLSPRFGITTEARYDWGRAELNEFSYEGFEPIDLSGLSVTAGLHIRI
jgi:hypothetical protein